MSLFYRNSIHTSGQGKIRHLHIPSMQSYIVWEHWMEAYAWDRSNPIALHWKLGPSHIDLTNSSKMRNHRAEEALNMDMLLLMKEYK